MLCKRKKTSWITESNNTLILKEIGWFDLITDLTQRAREHSVKGYGCQGHRLKLMPWPPRVKIKPSVASNTKRLRASIQWCHVKGKYKLNISTLIVKKTTLVWFENRPDLLGERTERQRLALKKRSIISDINNQLNQGRSRHLNPTCWIELLASLCFVLPVLKRNPPPFRKNTFLRPVWWTAARILLVIRPPTKGSGHIWVLCAFRLQGQHKVTVWGLVPRPCVPSGSFISTKALKTNT